MQSAPHAPTVRLAAQPEFQPGGDRFRVLLDPAGHPFYIIDRAVAAQD